MNQVVTAALTSGWARVDDEAGGEVTDLPTALGAVADTKGVTGEPGGWIIVSADGAPWALGIIAARAPQRAAL